MLANFVFDLDSVINYRRAMIGAYIDMGITKEFHEWDEILARPDWPEQFENGADIRRRMNSKLPPYAKIVTPTNLLPFVVKNHLPVLSTLTNAEVLILLPLLIRAIPQISEIKITLTGVGAEAKADYMDFACKVNDSDLIYVQENPAGLEKLKPRANEALGSSRWHTMNIEQFMEHLKTNG